MLLKSMDRGTKAPFDCLPSRENEKLLLFNAEFRMRQSPMIDTSISETHETLKFGGLCKH